MSPSIVSPRSQASLIFLFWVLLASSAALLQAQLSPPPPPSTNSSCPLNFTLLNEVEAIGNEVRNSNNVTFRCVGIIQALHLVLADYVDSSGYFLVPQASAEACWNAFDSQLSSMGDPVNVRSVCNLNTLSIARGSDNCQNVESVADLERVIPVSFLSDISNKCVNASPDKVASCSDCTVSVVQAGVNHLSGSSNGSVNSCQDLISLYAVYAVPNASKNGTALCLFNIQDVQSTEQESKHVKYIYAAVGASVALIVVLALVVFFYLRHRKRRIAKQKQFVEDSKSTLAKSMNENSTLIWYTIDEIKEATNNFARTNIVGSGGFGNVYKGTLPDGTVIAVKRFKNCSPAGDTDFFHEVKVISSVRHRNLVALRGCCVHSSTSEGHQRIIIYDYMPNGSLHDHLFSKKTRLDWPTRQNIALGMAKGLAYLHQEIQPAIIHRDIKPSNILLDAKWNARVADFGLAKFTPEGATHVTTRVAGTHGYLAPEYVLYNQLTEKSDVYSFGIVLLELLTGKKILSSRPDSNEPLLITDWAWALVKQNKVADVLDPDMDNLGPSDTLERYVLLALLCSHPQVPCRPTIDQVLKIMENDNPLPVIPDRPIPLTSGIKEIEMAVGGSDGLTSSRCGFQSFSSDGSSVR